MNSVCHGFAPEPQYIPETLRDRLYNRHAMSNYCVIRESALGRWYLANAGDESLPWSGMRWVPHVQGIPAARPGPYLQLRYDEGSNLCTKAHPRTGEHPI